MSKSRPSCHCPFSHHWEEFSARLEGITGLAESYQARYCLGCCQECARYQVGVHLGAAGIPQNLYPNQHERAQAIVRQALGTVPELEGVALPVADLANQWLQKYPMIAR